MMPAAPDLHVTLSVQFLYVCVYVPSTCTGGPDESTKFALAAAVALLVNTRRRCHHRQIYLDGFCRIFVQSQVKFYNQVKLSKIFRFY